MHNRQYVGSIKLDFWISQNLAAMIANPTDLVVPRAMPLRTAKNTAISGAGEAPSVDTSK